MTIKNVTCLAALTLLTLGNTGCGGPGSNRDSDPQSADILITNGTIITMDGERRVLENAAIAIVGDRIAAIGPTEELEASFAAEQVIDADIQTQPHRGLVIGTGQGFQQTDLTVRNAIVIGRGPKTAISQFQ